MKDAADQNSQRQIIYEGAQFIGGKGQGHRGYPDPHDSKIGQDVHQVMELHHGRRSTADDHQGNADHHQYQAGRDGRFGKKPD